MTLKPLMKTATAMTVIVSLVGVSGCGYLLYPERQGQTGGRIDPVVAILDAAGLLFYLVPGIVAFAVDITNGTIYIPPGGESALDKHTSAAPPQDPEAAGWRAIPVEGPLSRDNVARTLNEALGTQVTAASIERMSQAGQLALHR